MSKSDKSHYIEVDDPRYECQIHMRRFEGGIAYGAVLRFEGTAVADREYLWSQFNHRRRGAFSRAKRWLRRAQRHHAEVQAVRDSLKEWL